MQKIRDQEFATKFGETLKNYIKASGLSRYGLSKRVGISSTSLNAFIRGHALPSLSTFKKLCDVLGAEYEDLL